MTASPDVQLLHALWAKADPMASGPSAGFHPLVCHSLDVAAVARALLERILPPAALRAAGDGLGLEPRDAARWIVLLAALHDAGKASPAFQTKVAHLAARLKSLGLPFKVVTQPVPHGTITAAVLTDLFTQRFGLPRPTAFTLATITSGHHGLFPEAPALLRAPTSAVGGPPWAALRELLVDCIADAVGVVHSPQRAPSHALSMFLAGLISVADWVGSNIRHFPYAGTAGAGATVDVQSYWNDAVRRAEAALAALGWNEWRPASPPSGFGHVFPGLRPVPIQAAAETLGASLAEPGLVLVEAPTGEGKTEAAMYLAEHWMSTGDVRGAYFALPSQATSNQMFTRVRDFLSSRRAERVTLQLIHGRAALSAELLALIEKSEMPSASETAVVYDDDAGDRNGHVMAAEWFTYRKRGLLSEFGVGTIDQALLAALQARHGFVRLFGLAHKVVILDEVHAYDTYMTALLERLLEWLGALGSPVVLLSATLPGARRRALLGAYGRGLGRTDLPGGAASPPYPRLTWLSRSGEGARHVPPRAASARTVHLRAVDGRLPEDGEWALASALRRALAGGGCAVVVCNTVRRAQQVYKALLSHFAGPVGSGRVALDLLHARFVFEDRDERERRVVRRFGRTGERPETAVLVATQIVEQSLDLDFDLLVTDLAPIDLILQRLGRLHRHERKRPAALAEPETWICMPPVDGSGCPVFDSGDRAVYAEHVLLRSWLALRGRAGLEIPADIERLIEEVYGEAEVLVDAPEALRRYWEETAEDLEKERRRHRIEAEQRWLNHPSSPEPLWQLTRSRLEEDAPDFHVAHQALTRLARPTVEVVLLYETDAGPSLLPGDRGTVVDLDSVPDDALTSALLRRSVAIGDERVRRALMARDVPRGWRSSPLLRRHRPVLLDATGAARVGNHILSYDRDLGVLISDGET